MYFQELLRCFKNLRRFEFTLANECTCCATLCKGMKSKQRSCKISIFRWADIVFLSDSLLLFLDHVSNKRVFSMTSVYTNAKATQIHWYQVIEQSWLWFSSCMQNNLYFCIFVMSACSGNIDSIMPGEVHTQSRCDLPWALMHNYVWTIRHTATSSSWFFLHQRRGMISSLLVLLFWVI